MNALHLSCKEKFIIASASTEVAGSYPSVMTKQKLICCLPTGTRVLPELGMQQGRQIVATLSLLHIHHNSNKQHFLEKAEN